MKIAKFFALAVALTMLLTATACSGSPETSDAGTFEPKSSGKIYLYGETHGIEKILDKELELWYDYYHNENMRHLFLELPYHTAEFLNIWMQSDNDDILDDIYNDWEGTLSYDPAVKEFYKKIKSDCPETIFHGTDVGHQYDSTGERFLNYLKENNMQDSEQYLLTQEAIEQAKYYYDNSDSVYRENKMTENFIREFDNLENESIMGIYGSAHTEINGINHTVPCMANQLRKLYGDNIYSESLSWIAKDIEPYQTDIITVNGKEYTALYFGEEDMTCLKDYKCREFWRLEDAYDDFKSNSKTGDVLPYNDYPMIIEAGQVFVIDYTKTDGSVRRTYYRSDNGYAWQGLPSTQEFTIE